VVVPVARIAGVVPGVLAGLAMAALAVPAVTYSPGLRSPDRRSGPGRSAGTLLGLPIGAALCGAGWGLTSLAPHVPDVVVRLLAGCALLAVGFFARRSRWCLALTALIALTVWWPRFGGGFTAVLLIGLCAGFMVSLLLRLAGQIAAGDESHDTRGMGRSGIIRGAGLLAGPAIGAGVATAFGLPLVHSPLSALLGLPPGLVLGAFVALIMSGTRAAAWGRARLTRLVLARAGRLPWRLGRFLDYASDQIVMTRKDRSYEFIHLLLRDHLAANAE
jgi:MFS family permease